MKLTEISIPIRLRQCKLKALIITCYKLLGTNINDLNELIQICRKRTVLSEKELKEYWEWKPNNRPFVINFLYAFSFIKGSH